MAISEHLRDPAGQLTRARRLLNILHRNRDVDREEVNIRGNRTHRYFKKPEKSS